MCVVPARPSGKRGFSFGCASKRNPVRSFDELKRILGPHFDLVKEVNLPMLIHETARKNQPGDPRDGPEGFCPFRTPVSGRWTLSGPTPKWDRIQVQSETNKQKTYWNSK